MTQAQQGDNGDGGGRGVADKRPLSFSNPQFMCSVGDNAAPAELRYIVFAGRSNAGKSSVINALCGGRFARVAKTPGRTRLINIFRLGGSGAVGGNAAIADLPGYGYAAVSKQEQRGWGRRLTRFLQEADIRCLVAVVDCRRGIGELDEQLFALYAPRRRATLIILNKADKLNRREQQAALAAATAESAAPVVLFSALKKSGVQAAQEHLIEHLSGHPSDRPPNE